MIGSTENGRDEFGQDMGNDYSFFDDGYGFGYGHDDSYDWHRGDFFGEGDGDGFGSGGGGWEHYDGEEDGFGCGYGSPGGSEDDLDQQFIRNQMGENPPECWSLDEARADFDRESERFSERNK
jgi:hypothetical protein